MIFLIKSKLNFSETLAFLIVHALHEIENDIAFKERLVMYTCLIRRLKKIRNVIYLMKSKLVFQKFKLSM